MLQTRSHQICEALVVGFDMTVVSQARYDDETHVVDVCGKAAHGKYFSAKLQSPAASVDSMALIEFADEIEQLLSSQASQIGLQTDE